MTQGSGTRRGITSLIIVVIIIVVVAAVGAGYYFYSATAVVSQTTGKGGVSISVTTTTKASSGTNTTYSGTFVFANPLGPAGINDSSGKPVSWNSTQSAHGTFTFSIGTSGIGSGKGQGSITVTTTGYCTGTATVPYTFTISAVHAPTEPAIISFNTPTPPSVTVQLNCKGSTRDFFTSNNPVQYLSVYPNGLSVKSFPTTQSQSVAGVSYTITITQTG